MFIEYYFEVTIMLISLTEYAKNKSKSADTVRRLAENGALVSAVKIGRNWAVDSEEPYPVKPRCKNEQPRITVVSLFSGCGGMDLGFVGDFDFLNKHYDRTAFDIIWANEISEYACKTYRKNLGNYIIEGDIHNVINQLPDYADVVIGGFPCQDISINGKMAGVNGKRSSLYTYIVEAVKRINPKVFVAENVGGLLLKQNEYSLNTIVKDFSSLGYDLTYQLYNTMDYGVPQTRQRVIFVGTRNDMPKFDPPLPTCSAPVTAKEALCDLENKDADKSFSHIWSKANVSGQQGNRKLLADRPGYTMRAECHGNIQFHYSLPRRISMREAARIQSFPDTFLFECGLRETERQIGNAVPPVFAWHIAKAVEKVIIGEKNDKTRI